MVNSQKTSDRSFLIKINLKGNSNPSSFGLQTSKKKHLVRLIMTLVLLKVSSVRTLLEVSAKKMSPQFHTKSLNTILEFILNLNTC
jgi:hypothetical protein